MPVATTETRTTPFRLGSNAAPEDDIRIRIDLAGDRIRRLVDFQKRHVQAAGDVDQHGLGALQRDLVEQRVLDGVLGGEQGAPLAGRFARSHHRLAHLGHDRADIGEVQVYQARKHHQIGDRAHTGVQHLVSHAESLGEGGSFVRDAEEILVGDDDQGVDVALQFADPRFGQAHAVTTFEVERLGHHADGQDAALAGALGDDRAGAGAGATTHPGGDEHHVSAVQVFADFWRGLFGRGHADFRMGPCAKALGDVDAELDATICLGKGELLRVGVGDDELDAFETRVNHVVDGVAAGPADPEHNDPWLQFLNLGGKHLERHGDLKVFHRAYAEKQPLRPGSKLLRRISLKETRHA